MLEGALRSKNFWLTLRLRASKTKKMDISEEEKSELCSF